MRNAWYYDPNFGMVFVSDIPDHGDVAIADLNGWGKLTTDELLTDAQTQEAEARIGRMIAAAPDLLYAAETVLRHEGLQPAEAFTLLEKAVKKAKEGGT